MPLTPDKIEVLNGVTVKTYLLTQHNTKGISLPKNSMPAPIGVTIHNTEAINVASNTTMAEQYTRATLNGNMNTVRVHFYVDDVCAWQNLPINIDSWHAADGNGNGNRKTISFEVIGNSAKAEANAAKLAAYFLNKIGKTPDNGLFTHTHWLNVRDGIKGDIDYLNTRKHPYKWCPIYILPHWSTFKNAVKTEFEKLGGKETVITVKEETKPATSLYRIRKDWGDVKSQIGAYSTLENAKKAWKEGYNIYNSNGVKVYPIEGKIDASAQTISKDKNITVSYNAYTAKKWQATVNNLEDYAGIKGNAISCIAMKVSKGKVSYRVHQRGSKWMNWITGYNLNDLIKGYAGVPNIAIDGVQVKFEGVDGYVAKYRVATIGGDYLPWVINDKDYAGIYGKKIDRFQIEIVKE